MKKEYPSPQRQNLWVFIILLCATMFVAATIKEQNRIENENYIKDLTDCPVLCR